MTPVPTASASTAAATPCAISLGLAYVPDSGNGGSFRGVQYTHFEDNDTKLCASGDTPASPRTITFTSSVGELGFAQDASDAIAILQGPGGGYTLAQDIFGTSVGALTPVGSPYDLMVQPTAAPTGVVSPAPTSTATAANAPLLSDASSVDIVGGSSAAVGLVLGTPATGSTPAIVALTSLTNAPPQYGNSVPFSGSSYKLQNIPNLPRNIVRIGQHVNSDGSTTINALVRGTQDLLVFKVTPTASGYQFNAMADDTTLGSYTTLRGTGAVAFDPADVGRALIGGTSTAGTGNVLTLVTGMPTAITQSSTITLPGATQIRSIAITTAGEFAVVGTDVGIFSIGGINGDSLSIVAPFVQNTAAPSANAPHYTACNSANVNLTNISSVGISSDQQYLVALGSNPAVTCASGYNDAIVALPYNPATGGTPSPSPTGTSTASPVPTQFVQNNVIAPPTGSDVMYVH